MSWLWVLVPTLIATASFACDVAEKRLAASVQSRLTSLLLHLQIHREKGKPVETVKEACQKLSEFLEGSRRPQNREAFQKAVAELDLILDKERSPLGWWLTSQPAIITQCDKLALALTDIKPIPYQPPKQKKPKPLSWEERDPIGYHAYFLLFYLQRDDALNASRHLTQLLKLLKEQRQQKLGARDCRL